MPYERLRTLVQDQSIPTSEKIAAISDEKELDLQDKRNFVFTLTCNVAKNSQELDHLSTLLQLNSDLRMDLSRRLKDVNEDITSGHYFFLESAIQHHNVAGVRVILEFSKSYQENNGRYFEHLTNALAKAAPLQNLVIIENLIAYGADPDLKSGSSYVERKTIASQAATQGNIPLLELVKYHSDISLALEQTFHEPDKRAYKLLLTYAQGHEIKPSFLIKDVTDCIFIGTFMLDQPIDEELLKQSGCVNIEKAVIKYVPNEHGPEFNLRMNAAFERFGKLIKNDIVNFVCLANAAKKGDDETVNIRLQAGVNPNHALKKKFGEKEYPIGLAAERGHVECVKLLLASPALDVTAIAVACGLAHANGHEATTTLLLKTLLLGGARYALARIELLHIAITNGQVNWVAELIQAGTDVNARCKLLVAWEFTPLQRAVDTTFKRKVSLPIIELLLKANADPNLGPTNMVSYNEAPAPLEMAIKQKDYLAMQLLLPVTKNITRIVIDKGSVGRPWYERLACFAFRAGLPMLAYLKDNIPELNLGKMKYQFQYPLTFFEKAKGDTLLHRIACQSDLDNIPSKFQALLDLGADPAEENDDKKLPYEVNVNNSNELYLLSLSHLIEKNLQTLIEPELILLIVAYTNENAKFFAKKEIIKSHASRLLNRPSLFNDSEQKMDDRVLENQARPLPSSTLGLYP